MRIAQIAPIAERVPPKKYGGTERVVYTLTDELVLRGHDVTLFATADSHTKAKLVALEQKGLRESKFKDPHGLNERTLLHIGNAYKKQEQFDIIHDHLSPLSLPTAQLATTPVVTTVHGPITNLNQRIYESMNNVSLVTISQAQAKKIGNFNLAGTVYHGLDFKEFPFGKTDQGYFLYVGRICWDKGLHHAIATAMYFNKPLIIAAKLDQVDKSYFQEYVKPYLSDDIQWVGEVDEKERNRLYSRALCLLHPVTWPEPFGLTMIEAMACGCPVVAFNEGSVPEVVNEGKSGFVVKNVDEMIDAVKKIASIERQEVRDYALSTFSVKRMVDAYEAIYEQILSRSSQSTRIPVYREGSRFIT